MTRHRSGSALLLAGLLVLGSCSTSKTQASGPTLRIVSPSNGTTIKGNVVSLDLSATGIQIVKPDGDTSGKTGHFHIFIDREPLSPGATIPKEPGIVHSPANPTLLTGFSVGEHTIAVVVGNGSHQRIGSAVARVTVRIDGPSVDASAPATATAGAPVTVTVKVAGVTLVKADGAPAGTTGHLHVLIDRDPPAAGQPIPKENGIIHTADTTIQVPGLAAGEHTIWVVLGDGNHVPYDPPVEDKVVVTVA